MELRLYREENQTWIEKAVVTRIWVATSVPNAEDALEPLQAFLDNVSHHTKQSLTGPGTHASQTVSEHGYLSSGNVSAKCLAVDVEVCGNSIWSQ